MKTAKFLQEFSKQFSEKLPLSLKEFQQEFEQFFQEGLSLALEKLSLINRQEFETQARVLARTREKVEQLELRVTKLEQEKHGTV